MVTATRVVKLICSFGIAVLAGLRSASFVEASEVLGVHILHPDELTSASELLKLNEDQNWHYVTIPLSVDEIDNVEDWQDFFDRAGRYRLIPIVRMTTRFNPELNAWEVPTRKEVVDWVDFLAKLDWPTNNRYIIILNETNHAKEYGGRIDPAGYADILDFASRWAVFRHPEFEVLPGAMDLAADGNLGTMQAIPYLDQMVAAEPTVFDYISYWNSHSYPNPGFSAPPTTDGLNSLRGFEYELAWLRSKVDRELQVFITETGWEENTRTRYRLNEYYAYAYQNIWSDDRIKAITPFVLRGAPGPFAGFSLLDETGQPTYQYLAYRQLIEGAGGD